MVLRLDTISATSTSGTATRCALGSEAMASSLASVVALQGPYSALMSRDTGHGRRSGGVSLGVSSKLAAFTDGSFTSRSRSRFYILVRTIVSTTKQKRGTIPDLHGDDDDDDDDETEFADMEEWMTNKPSGFGLTEYDTSLEDRLLAEIEADKKAQASAVSSKKASLPTKKPGKAAEKQDTPPEGIEVFVGNLPKKRNVDRDLRAAFRSAEGLLHIRPILEGNEKTREPVCKGLAFLTFATDDDAKDFIEIHNGEKVKFGKMEKKVTCEMATPNSPFKKQMSQKQGMGVLRLDIRETSAIHPTPASSLSSPITVELVDITNSSAVENNLSDRPHVSDVECVEDQDEDADALEVSEDDLLQLEREVWAELENEDDYKLDCELGEDDSEGPTVAEGGTPTSLDDGAEGSQDLGQVDTQSPHLIQSNEAENVVTDEDEEGDIQEARSGQGFRLAQDKRSAAAGDKDKRIQELESRLKELQLQLKNRNLTEFSRGKVMKHSALSKEESVEALEKRVLSKARAALEKDTKIKSSKKLSVPKKAVSPKARGSAKENAFQPKTKSLGAASRLRKKERKIYTEVLSKYSPVTKQVVM